MRLSPYATTYEIKEKEASNPLSRGLLVFLPTQHKQPLMQHAKWKNWIMTPNRQTDRQANSLLAQARRTRSLAGAQSRLAHQGQQTFLSARRTYTEILCKRCSPILVRVSALDEQATQDAD